MHRRKQAPVRHIDSILPPPVKNSRRPFWRHRRVLGLVFGLVLLILIAVVFHVHRGAHKDLNNVNNVMTAAAKHYRLPSNEKPALATVTDSGRLQSSFSGLVDNGDKILIYQKNKKAIVYRPSIDRIVDVEPVSIDSPPSANTNQ